MTDMLSPLLMRNGRRLNNSLKGTQTAFSIPVRYQVFFSIQLLVYLLTLKKGSFAMVTAKMLKCCPGRHHWRTGQDFHKYITLLGSSSKLVCECFKHTHWLRFGSRGPGCGCSSGTGCPETWGAVAVYSWAVWPSGEGPADQTHRHPTRKGWGEGTQRWLSTFSSRLPVGAIWSNLKMATTEIYIITTDCL